MSDADVKGDAPKQLGRILLKRRPASAVARSREPILRHAQLVALSERYGVPALDLDQVCVKTEDLGNVPRSLAQHHLLIPVLARPDRLFVAMKDPSQKEVIQEVEFVSGKRVYAYAAPAEDIADAIERAYLARERGDAHFVGPTCPPETLRKAGLLPEEPEPVRVEQVVPPSVEPMLPEEPARDNVLPVLTESFLPRDPGPPATVSAYPQRHSSLPSALRTRSGDVDEETVDAFSAMEQAFDDLFEEASAVYRLPPDSEPRAPETPHPKMVLIVGDEPETRTLLESVLRDEGYVVRVAEDGRLALRMIKELGPDVLLLGALHPDVLGVEIARRLRGSQRYGNMPIVMIGSEYRGWPIAEELRDVALCIEKPLRLEEIQKVVSQAVRAKSVPVEATQELSDRAEMALAEGMAAYRIGDTQLAIHHLERGVAIDPLAYRLHLQLGLLFAQQGQTYDAIRALERAVEINSLHFAGVKNLAIMYSQAGFRNRAVELWTRCLVIAPDDETREAIQEHLAGLLSQEGLS